MGTCPLEWLREAWVVYRHDAAVAGNPGGGWAGARRPGQQRLAASAIALYEAFVNERPPGWPATGTAALVVLAAQRRTSSRLPRTSEKPARRCLLDHAAELHQAIAHLASAHVLVDVARRA